MGEGKVHVTQNIVVRVQDVCVLQDLLRNCDKSQFDVSLSHEPLSQYEYLSFKILEPCYAY